MPDDQVVEVDRFAEWETYTYRNIKARWISGHPHAETLPAVVQGYTKAIRRNCLLLEMSVPKDTLLLFFHTGPGQGQKLTGHEYPYASGDSIHFWVPSFLGVTLMQYLIPRWIPAEPKYSFLKHGLIALCDESQQDYHQETQDLIHQGRFIPLAELAVDTTINSDIERVQTAEAASFVDFLIYMYGLPAYRALYLGDSPFELVVEGMLKIKPDQLETEWLEYTSQVTAGEIPTPKDLPWRPWPPDTTGRTEQP